MSIGQPVIATDRQFILDETNILADPATGMPVADWSRDATIVNKVDIGFDFNDPVLVQDDFARRRVYVAEPSSERHNLQQPVKLELRGVRTDQGGNTLTDDLALIYLQRWGYAPPFLKVGLIYRGHTLEPGDRVLVTHPLITNPISGKLGLHRERFEVLDVTPSWLTEGRLELLLLWVGAIETSPVPTSKLVNLIPGLNELDPTDVPVPLAGSVTLTTPESIRSFRVGLKRLTYRGWRCLLHTQIGSFDKGGNLVCEPGPDSTISRSYTGSVTYRMEYKTQSAPDAPGTGSDPTTGWVQLLAPKTVGSVALFSAPGCGGVPSLPAEQFFSEFFETPAAAPNQYNVKVFYTAVGAQADPCPGVNPNQCNVQEDPFAACIGGSLASSTLYAEKQDLTVDYLETIT